VDPTPDIHGGPKVHDLSLQSIPEKGRQDSIIGTNRYWSELLVVKKRVPRKKYSDAVEFIHV
jgi:hypothetical protein